MIFAFLLEKKGLNDEEGGQRRDLNVNRVADIRMVNRKHHESTPMGGKNFRV